VCATHAHLIVLAFFFLFCMGEYTCSSGKWLTAVIRKQDVKLDDVPNAVLLTADAVPICLENQKKWA
jgi:hypothetical protein